MNSKFLFAGIGVFIASIFLVFKVPNLIVSQSIFWSILIISILSMIQAIYDDRVKISQTRSRSLANPETTTEKVLAFILSPKIFGFIAPVVLGWIGLNSDENIATATDGVQSLVAGDASKIISIAVGFIGILINNYFKNKLPKVEGAKPELQ
jgi:UDP-N-acetylmuramyl pentapeptide phosphotransferase/UDP-N-acetylglucosamine-1-phosphate transferase